MSWPDPEALLVHTNMRTIARDAFVLSFGPAAAAAASGCTGSSSNPPAGPLDATAADTYAPDAVVRDSAGSDAANAIDANAAADAVVRDAAAPDAANAIDANAATDAADAATGPGALFSLDGSFDALAIRPVDGFGTIVTAVPGPLAEAGVNSNFLAFVADRPALCAGVLRQSETVVSIDALSANSTFAPDRFVVTSEVVPTAVTVEVTRFDDTCGVAGQYVAVSGSVNVTSVTSAKIAGTFDVALSGDAGTLQGSFDVPLCSADADAAQTCAP